MLRNGLQYMRTGVELHPTFRVLPILLCPSDEVREDGSANEEHGVADDIEGGSENKRRSGSGGGGSGDGGGSAEGRKGDLRRGVDMTPSGTEMRAFVSSFEDVVVNPPQVSSILLFSLFFFFFALQDEVIQGE